MLEETLFAGFGGQGILFAAQVLAHAAMIDGKRVAWVPSYGPEMRGGTASATVIISNEEIGTLVGGVPSAALIMNGPSLDKYEALICPGGFLVVNSSLVHRPPERGDIEVVEVEANDVAVQLGNERLANVVALGVLVGVTGLVPEAMVVAALRKTLSGPKAHLLAANETALARGIKIALSRRTSALLATAAPRAAARGVG